MKLLTPDLNGKILKHYHTGNKLILPLVGLSSLLHYANVYPPATRICDSTCVMMVGFHSYVSISSVITDYLKYPILAKACRTGNLGFHGVATLGLLKYCADNMTTCEE